MKSQISEAPLNQQSAASANNLDSLSVEQRESVERLKRLYKADQQAEYLYIQAEVDSLWIKLQQAMALSGTIV